MTRVVIYSSPAGAQQRLRPLVVATGGRFYERPPFDDEPGLQRVELAIHWNQAPDADFNIHDPGGGAVEAVCAALCGDSYADVLFAGHYNWVVRHRERIRSVWVLSGGPIPEADAAPFKRRLEARRRDLECRFATVHAYEASLDAVSRLTSSAALRQLHHKATELLRRREFQPALAAARDLGTALRKAGCLTEAQTLLGAGVESLHSVLACEQIRARVYPAPSVTSVSATAALSPEHAWALEGATLLLVDDDEPAYLEHVVAVFQNHRVDVTHVRNADLAIREMAIEVPLVVAADVSLDATGSMEPALRVLGHAKKKNVLVTAAWSPLADELPSETAHIVLCEARTPRAAQTLCMRVAARLASVR